MIHTTLDCPPTSWLAANCLRPLEEATLVMKIFHSPYRWVYCCVFFCLFVFRADDDFSEPVNTNIVLRYDGKITWDAPAITKSSCVVDVSYFPFDSQQCNLTFGSWTYNGNQVDIFNTLDSGDLSDLIEDVEWEIHGMPAVKNVITYGCCSEPYPDVTFTLVLKRKSSFYIFNLLLPCLLISFLAPLGFYLPADSGEKVSLGVTVLLSLTVFQLMVAESMPPSDNVPLIGTCIYL